MINRGRLSRIRRDNDDDDDPSLVVPEDVFIKVLSWLPVKSLLRFRCLSKRWLDFISSDPHFIHLHSQQSKSKPPLLFCSSSPFLDEEGNENDNIFTDILQSSMDMEGRLLSKFTIRSKNTVAHRLMLPTRFDLVCFTMDGLIHVCNPSTRELITLPPLVHSDGGDRFGFGYVESTDEYKIVHLIPPFFDTDYIEEHPHAPTECKIFTLGMTEVSPSSYASPWAWRHIGNSPYHVEASYPAFVDGALHWLISRCRHIDEFETDIEKTILAFNLESEEFKLVPRPQEECLDITTVLRGNLRLVELRGLLSLSCVAGDKMDIWMLKEYHTENRIFTWVKEYSIDLGTFKDALYFPRDIQDDKVLIDSWDGVSFHYHLQSRRFSAFVGEKGRYSFFSFYAESLRSLRHVLQKSFNFDQITEDTHFQSQRLADLDPPIYIVRVYALFDLPEDYAYGGYITNVAGHFVVVEGKILDAEDSIEAEAKAILYGLRFARRKGIQCIGLVSNAREIVDAITTREWKRFQRLEKILTRIINLLSKFTWAQIFHDRRMSTQVACQLALHALWDGTLCFTVPPKWFIDG